MDYTTQGSYYDKWTPVNYAKEFYYLIKRNIIDVTSLISHTILPLDAPLMYQRLLNKDEDVFGVVIDWSDN